METPLISICIPTYRRSSMLGEALASVARQATSEIEVVICEQPSEDTETARIIAMHRDRLPRLTYIRNETNLGFDGNFLKVMSLANGEYCWPLSDDDQLEPGGLAHVVSALKSNQGLTGLTLNRFAYNSSYTEVAYERPFRQQGSRIFTDLSEMYVTLLDQLAFVSGMVLSRQDMLNATKDERLTSFKGTGYMPLFLSVLMMQQHPRWLYISERCVGWRRDNDSFLERGAMERLRLDVEGYEKVTSAFLARNSRAYREAMVEIVTRHVRHHIVHARLGGESIGFSWNAAKLCVRHYGRIPDFWLRVFPLLILPRALIGGMRDFVRRLRPSTAG